MSKPGTPNRRGMIDRLKYGRLADPAELTEEQRRQLADDPELARELQLNKALELGRPEIPERDNPASLVDRAVDLARRGEQPRVTSPWRWPAAAFALGAAAVLVILALQLPLNIQRSDKGMEVALESAWATGNGYILDYTIEFDDHYTGTSADSPDHPLWRIQRILADWSARRHGAEGPPDGSPAAVMETGYSQFRPIGGANYQYNVYVKVFSASEAEITGLIAELAEISELSEPEVSAEYWFFNQDVPDTYFTGRKVVINGRSYTYPQEMDLGSLEMFEMLLQISGEAGQLYFALDDIPEYSRYNLGDVIKVWWPDSQTVEIETVPVELDFASLGLPSWYHDVSVYVPAAEVDVDFDLLKLLRSYSGSMAQALERGLPGFGDQLVVPLVPTEVWLGVPPEELAGRLGPEGIAKLEGQAVEMNALFETIKADHPDTAYIQSDPRQAELIAEWKARGDLGNTDPGNRLTTHLVRYGGVPTHWVAEVALDRTERILTRLADSLRRAGYEDYTILPNLPEAPEVSRLPEWEQNRQMIPNAVVIWMFLPQTVWTAIPREERAAGLREEFTPEELAAANAQGAVVERVYHEWVAVHPELGERIQADHVSDNFAMKSKLMPNVEGEQMISVYVHVLDEDRDAAQAWIDELIELVKATGEVTTEPTTRMEQTTYYPPE